MSWAELATLALFVAGALLWVELLRSLFPTLSRRSALLVALPAVLFWGPYLATGSTSLWTTAVYGQRPWRGLQPPPARAPRATLATDPLLQMAPYRHLVRERLARGELPHWAPELGSGSPLLANGQSAVFSPIEALARPWPAVPAATLVAGWQSVVGALLTAALALGVGARRAGAWFAAQGYGLALGSLAWSHYPLGGALAWVPGVLAALLGVRAGRARALPALVCTATALALSGHPETLAHTALVAALLAAVLSFGLDGAARRRFWVRVAAAAALAFCLSAPALLPLVGELGESERGRVLQLEPAAALPPPFEPRLLVPLVAPFAFGNPRHEPWRGPWNFYEASSAFPGSVALALMLAGALVLRGRALQLGLGAVAALLVALRAPPLGSWIEQLPLLAGSATGRLRLVWVLLVVVAAGWSAERLRRCRGGGAALVLTSAAVAALTLAGSLVTGWPSCSGWIQTSLALLGLLLLALCAGLRGLRRHLAWAAGAALVVELAVVAALVTPRSPGRFDLAPPEGLRVAIARALAERPQPAPRFAAFGWDAHPNLAALWGLWDIRPNDPMAPWAPRALLDLETAGSTRPGELPRLSRGDSRALERWGVRFLLTPRRLEPGPEWRALWEEGSSRLSERIEPRALFFVAEGVTTVPDRGRALELAARREKLATVGVERPLQAIGGGAAQILEVRPIADGFEIDFRASAPALIASTVAWGAGWRATLEGEPQPVERIDGTFVGALVPAVTGPRSLRLVYRSVGWESALVLLAAGLLAAAGWAISSGASRRLSIPPAAPARSR